MNKKIISVVGARPNFIKLAALSSILSNNFDHKILHTGQHYDYELSRHFFDELEMPTPNWNLNVGSSSHGDQTAAMIKGIEKILLYENPSLVVVYGDTNTTLAGSLAAAKLGIPVAHIEAGTRSFDKKMPEEINRIITDHISEVLLCPSKLAVKNLKKEGLTKNVFVTGDVMYDIFLNVTPDLSILKRLKLITLKYYFATIHRQKNTEDSLRLKKIIELLDSLDLPVIFPVHPRTKKAITKNKIRCSNIIFVNPLKFSYNLALQKNSKAILTDSGGIQKEAYWLRVPCITFRNSTEWPEIVETGWNVLIEYDRSLVRNWLKNYTKPKSHPDFYGTGNASQKTVSILKKYLL